MICSCNDEAQLIFPFSCFGVFLLVAVDKCREKGIPEIRLNTEASLSRKYVNPFSFSYL